MDEIFDDEALTRRTDVLFAARLAAAAPRRGGPALRPGFADLVAYMTDPGRQLSMDEQRALFADPALRGDLRRLRADLAAIDIPRQAAADSATTTTRKFPGGSLRWHPSRVAGQIYLLVQFEDRSTLPKALVLESADGTWSKRSLPTPDADGRMLLVLDEALPDDAALLRSIADPIASGSFLI